MMDFRAAYWVSADGQEEICLTTEQQQDDPDGELVDMAEKMLAATGLKRQEGDRIEIRTPPSR